MMTVGGWPAAREKRNGEMWCGDDNDEDRFRVWFDVLFIK